MSTREYAYSLIDSMTEEQLKGFILLFGGLVGSAEVPNEETYEAISEVEDMKRHPEKYKGYDDVDVMFKELLS